MVSEKANAAKEKYLNGYNCAQAVISVFAKDLGLDEVTAYKMFEGFGAGFGGRQEVCGAFSAATAVISYYMATDAMDGSSKAKTFKTVRKAAELFEKEYGSLRCREILKGESPKAFQCDMKVYDAVLFAEKVLKEAEE